MRRRDCNAGGVRRPGGSMPKTLLLADDSVTIQKVVGISLANEDIRLVTVENGDDAVTRARETRPDIVLADIVMPGKNGYEVCEAIKGDPNLGGTPVLLLTGTFEPFDSERARQVGADGHITKPFEAQALVDQVNQLLARATSMGSGEAAPAAPAAEATSARSADASPAADVGAHGEGGDAFDFFEGEDGDTSWPTGANEADTSGLDLMAETSFGGTPGQAEETVLLDPNESSGDPDFDAAVEAAAFDAPGMKVPFQAPDEDDEAEASAETTGPRAEDSGFDIERGDLSLSSPNGETTDALTEAMDDTDGAPASAEAPDTTGPPPPSIGFDPPEETAPPAGTAASADGEPPASQPIDLVEPAPAEAPIDLTESAPAEASIDLAEPAPAEAPINLAEPAPTEAPINLAEPAPADPLAGFDPGVEVPPSEGSATPVQVFDDPGPVLDDPGPHESTHGFEVPEDSFHAAGEPAPAVDDAGWDAPPAVVEDADPARVQSPGDVATPASAPSAGRPEISPALEQHVHATLEKVAWEAFGDLSEQLVKQVLARVEAVAWEVIPQMAEVLIKEEIERMKSDSGESDSD